MGDGPFALVDCLADRIAGSDVGDLRVAFFQGEVTSAVHFLVFIL